MLRKELNDKLVSMLKGYFEKNGYLLKKTGEVIYFRCVSDMGHQHIAISSANYYDIHYLSYAYGKRVDAIENLMGRLEKYFAPDFFNLGKNSLTYAFSPNRILNEKEEVRIEFDQDISKAARIISEFTDKHALPLFKLLEDVKKVDSIINGEQPNFWIDDNNQKFGIFRFDVRRIIIAKLAKSPGDYKVFTEKLMAIEEKRIDEIRRSDEKYKDLKNWFVPKVLTHLEEIM